MSQTMAAVNSADELPDFLMQKVKMTSDNVHREDVKLPEDQCGRLAFVLYNVLTPKECERYIQDTEQRGYEKALINVGGGRQVLMTDIRNSDRCIVDSEADADTIWQRIKSHIPSEWNDQMVVGLNERLRFLRYDPGQYFKPHFDGSYERENGDRSYITIQLYLNEGFKGGSTTFLSLDGKKRVEVVPKTGAILVFQHSIYHEGSKLKKGRKYAMRTDVMYTDNLAA